MCSTMWEPLLDLASIYTRSLDESEKQAVGDQMTEEFILVAHGLAKDKGMGKERASRQVPTLRLIIARAIDTWCKLHRRVVRTQPETAKNNKAWSDYSAAKDKAEKFVVQNKRRSWRRALEKVGAQAVREPRHFWKFAANVAKWKPKDTRVGSAQPVKDPKTGHLFRQENRIGSKWSAFFGELAKEGPTWDGQWSEWLQHPKREELTELNDPISERKVMDVLVHPKRNKAAGSDWIPAGYLKLAQGRLCLMGAAIWRTVLYM